MLGFLVDREVSLVHPSDLIASQVLLELFSRVIDRQLTEYLVADRGILLLERSGVVAEGVFTAVVAVLGNLVDEEE